MQKSYLSRFEERVMDSWLRGIMIIYDRGVQKLTCELTSVRGLVNWA